MLSCSIAKPSNLRLLTLVSSQTHFSNNNHHIPPFLHPPIPNPNIFNCFPATSRYFSSNDDNNNINGKIDLWKLSSENDESIDSVFGVDTGGLEGIVAGEDANVSTQSEEESWVTESKKGGDDEHDIFKGIDDCKEIGTSGITIDDEHDIFKGIDDSKEIGTSGITIDAEWKTEEGYKDWNFVVEKGRKKTCLILELEKLQHRK